GGWSWWIWSWVLFLLGKPVVVFPGSPGRALGMVHPEGPGVVPDGEASPGTGVDLRKGGGDVSTSRPRWWCGPGQRSPGRWSSVQRWRVRNWVMSVNGLSFG